jgi:hypothetical protein
MAPLVADTLRRMGAWGHEPFANDAALDWLASAERDDALLRMAFDVACDSPYLEVDEGSSAVAAAAILAAAVDGNAAALPEAAQQLAQRIDADRSTRARAVDAVDAVLSESSELRALWDEGDGSAWRDCVAGIRARIAPQGQ